MSAACPNIKSEQWLKTVEKTSYFEAYRLFVANGFDMPPFAFKDKIDVEKYLNFIPQLKKKGDVWFVPFKNDLASWMSNTSSVKTEIQRVNKLYKGLLTFKEKPTTDDIRIATGRKSIGWVELNPQALVEYYKVYEDPIQTRKDIEDSGLIPSYEQREGFSLSNENREDFEKKKTIMLKTFPRITEVIEDTSMPQSGVLEANGTIIRVNPNKWTTDTIGHEFGHLLIDLMGGMSNPLIKKARKQLIGSDIERRVQERYPDLVDANDDRIDKEIVAQAIGEQTAKIFTQEKDRAEWKNILTRILERIKKLLHIDHNASKELARIVLSGGSINTDSTINIDFAEKRAEEEYFATNKSKKNLSKIEKIREDIINTLTIKYDRYNKKGLNSKINKVEEALVKIKELDDSPIEAIKIFQEFAISQTQYVYDRYSVAKLKHDKLIRGEGGGKAFTLRDLDRWRDYVSGFAMLSELAELSEGIDIDTSEKEQGLQKILSKARLSEAVRQKDVIEKAYVEYGSGLVADFLTPHSKHIEAEFKDIVEREYNKLSVEEKALKSKEKYLKERLGVNQEEIASKTKALIKEELLKASRDINQAQRWIDNVLDSPDAVVSAMASAFVEADFKARQEYHKVQDGMVKVVEDLEKFYTKDLGITKNIKGIYNFMLEQDKSGNYTQNIVAPYMSNLWDDYNSYKKSLEDTDLSYDKVQDHLMAWKEDNMPIDYTRFNRAKDSFYKDLIDKKIITRKEKEAIEVNSHWRNANRKDVADIVSEEAASIVHEWFRDTIWRYRLPADIYKNSQWLELVEIAGGFSNMDIPTQIKTVEENKTNDPRLAFYNYINKQNERLQKGVPYGHRLHNRLPSVLKDTGERAQDKQSPVSLVKHAINSSVNVLADEADRGERILTDESGKPVHFIPIYYTTNLKRYYQNEYDNLSDDKKSKINRNDYAIKKAEENQSYDLASIYSRYYSSAINYKHKYAILPEMEMARYLVNERSTSSFDNKGNIIKDLLGRDKKTKADNLANQLNDWFESQIYGIKEKEEGTIFWGTVDVAKTADTLNKYTALNLLGLNFITGTANVILGSTMQTIEAAGGHHYSIKDMSVANKIYFKNLPGIMGDIGTRKPSNKISLLLRKFDVLNEYQGVDFKRNTKFRQLLTTNTLFFTSHAGEHFMQTKVLLATLNKLHAIDSKGNDLGPMINQYSVVKGELVLNKEVVNFSEKEQSLFEAKVRRVLSSLHGEYSEAGRVAVQRYALGRMAYMFRKFVVPGIRRRYQRKQVNNGMGEYVEGNYRTTGRFLHNFIKEYKWWQVTLMATEWKSINSWEKANIRKTLVETSFLLTAMLMSTVLINMKEDADDDDKWLLSFLGYQALRLKTELGFFINISEAMKILRSPAASMSVIENTIKLLSQMMPPSFNGFERYERGSWKGRYKIEKTAINFVPGMKQIYRTKNIADQITWLR